MSYPLALILTREESRWQSAVIRNTMDLHQRTFEQVIWLRPPNDEQRDIARVRLRSNPSSDDQLGTHRLPPEPGQYDHSPYVRTEGRIATYPDARNGTTVLVHNFEIHQRVTNHTAFAARVGVLAGEADIQPGEEPERPSIWLARTLVPRLPAADIAELLAACMARQLNPDV